MYGLIATGTGWTFAQIDELDLIDVSDLLDYWREHPPVHLSVDTIRRGLMTVRGGGAATDVPRGTSAPEQGHKPTKDELMAFVAAMNGGGR